MEFLILIGLAGYLYYLRKYADFRTPSDTETASPADGIAPNNAGATAPKAPFFDKRLAVNMIMILLTSALLLYVIQQAESIHLPYLIAVFAAISIGFVEPYKGWLLAIMQCLMLLAGYFLFTALPEDGARQELENFSLYGSMILTFAASFLGGFLKRALNMK